MGWSLGVRGYGTCPLVPVSHTGRGGVPIWSKSRMVKCSVASGWVGVAACSSGAELNVESSATQR